MTEEEQEELNRLLRENAELRATIDELTEAAENLLLHSVPYAHGSPGIVVDADIAARTPCKCYGNICFSRGIIGALNPAQREAYCPTVEEVTSPGMTKRIENWQEAVNICKAEIKDIPRGERLEPWLSCMGRELPAHGIAI